MEEIAPPAKRQPGQARPLRLGDTQVELADFLDFCRSQDPASLPPLPSGIDPHFFAERFLAAGRRELEAITERDGWIQAGIALDGPGSPDLYAAIGALFADACRAQAARNAFFMHKPPGLRIRLQAAGADIRPSAEALVSDLEAWRRRSWIVGYELEAYEPETTLFGGQDAMDEVHRLFTADSAFWLGSLSGDSDQGVRLVAALVGLRSAFTALGIVDWEDLEVWRKVRDRTGRSLGDRSGISSEMMRALGAELVGLWREPAAARAQLDMKHQQGLEALAKQYEAIMPAWRRSCASAMNPAPSPRAAAALYTIFFWNRAGLSFPRQQLLAECLAHRSELD